MKRRALLASVGLSSIGVGAAFGSGAFTTIEADRSVELNVENDDSAQIIFRKGGGIGADRLIGTDDSNAVDVIEFSRNDLNEQSKTTFESALIVKNNTGSGDDDGFEVRLYVLDETNIGAEDAEILDFRADDEDDEDDGDDETNSIVGDGNGVELERSDTAELDIVVDLRDGGSNDLTDIDRVTFVVEAVGED